MGISFTGSFSKVASLKAGKLIKAWIISMYQYDGVFLNVSNEDTTPRGIVFNNDGTRLFVVGYDNDQVYQYALTTPYDITSASYSGNSFYVGSEETYPFGIAFSSDGTKMFIAGTNSDRIHQYNLGTAFDITSATYSGNSLYVGSEDGAPRGGITFSKDGSKFYVVGSNSNRVYQYVLSIPYDITSASYSDSSLHIGNEDTAPNGIAFSGDGTKLFLAGNENNRIYQYSI